ncbi:MAG: hypothetical protein JF586_11885 [Burkholderiales bacterium]|nr:hypothetical protein [Burkholderiales bacterium]
MFLRMPFARTPDVLRTTACAVLAMLVLSAGAADPAATPPSPAGKPVTAIDPDELVFDRTQSEWSQAYLQWVAAFPRGSSPVSDATGALCAAKQSGEVWFLASSDGTAPVERQCVVPAGKTLFVPVASVLERSGNREPDCAAMARVAATNLTHVNAMSLVIDGRPLDELGAYRQPSGGCFALGLRLSPRQDARQAVSDGWFAMLPPLAPGPHTIVARARFDSTVLSTTYQLDVH